jgi:hypothetical protein
LKLWKAALPPSVLAAILVDVTPLVVLVCNECQEKRRNARYKADTWQGLGEDTEEPSLRRVAGL